MQKLTVDTIERALNLEFNSDAGNNLTIRDYFYSLLKTLWDEGEGFSGKRPFGNSGWEHDLYRPLITAGFISGRIDEDGYIEGCNEAEGRKYIDRLMIAVFYGVETAGQMK